MSAGALVSLVSKGAQDVFIMNNESEDSHFRAKYTRRTNFSQFPKLIKTIDDKHASIVIPSFGDIINAVWFEGYNLPDLFFGSTVDLYIGGVKVDSHKFDYISDVWQNYMADTWVKSQEINNKTSTTNTNFQPMHFFFCDHKAFLPLCAIHSHEVEIRVNFDLTKFNGRTQAQKTVRCYGNFVVLDTDERKQFMERKIDLLITQCQSVEAPLTEHVTDNEIQEGGRNVIDISSFNHPVKSLFFGYVANESNEQDDRFTFSSCDIMLNGQPLLEDMTPTYFHTVQNYYKSDYGVCNFVLSNKVPLYTRYFAYHFCLNASDYFPTGSTNFSRLDSARLVLRGVEKGQNRASDQHLTVYAVNYQILTIHQGLAGIRFGS